MVSTSKILTVSYGTFSCTLEGFDDSFNTMKAIAEYFRDLAADDRYFGAEPPTPDAEMLARIAEKEIARRVEARQERGAIVLRASEAAAAEQTAAALTPDADTAEARTPEPKAETPAPVAEAPAPVAEAAPQAPAVDDITAETPAPAEDAAPETTTAEEAIADAVEETIADAVEETPAPVASVEETMEVVAAAPVVEDVAATADAVAEPVEDIADAPVAPAADDNSIAAKLQRIRAVVSRNTADDTSDFSEDEHAEAFLEDDSATLDAVLAEGADADPAVDTAYEDDATLADILAETRDDEIEDDSAFDQYEDTDLADATEEIAEVETSEEVAATDDADDVDAMDDIAETIAAEEAAEPAFEDADLSDDDEDDVASILDRLAGLSDDDAQQSEVETAAIGTPDIEPAADADDEDDALSSFFADSELDAATAEDIVETQEDAVRDEDWTETAEDQPEATDEEERPSLRARVVKMKRADFEAAIAEGHLEESDEDGWDDEDDWNALDDSSLSPEEEAELQRELAEVEAELDEGDDDADLEMNDALESIFAEADDDTPDMQDRRSARDQLDEAASEKDMTRLMAKTMSEMDEPESANRRNAIAHLRAAVAATRADKEAGVPAREDTIGEAFRDDLASVVRPRRPRAEGMATARPTEQQRPAPLKLVAEQRIDAPATPAAPVRPRRVSMTDVQDTAPEAKEAADSAESFADYVETMGAHDLPDILEAAASYLAFIEGRDQFSRPQLMTRARSVIGDEFSREDGLRSFGQLLRQGKIQKIKGGRFTVSEEIGFQPSERRAG